MNRYLGNRVQVQEDKNKQNTADDSTRNMEAAILK
jgi:hypothetical protein